MVAFIIGLIVFYSASVHPLTRLLLSDKSLTLDTTGRVSYGFRYTPPTFFFNAVLTINNTALRDVTLRDLNVTVFVNDEELNTKTDLESSLEIPAGGYHKFQIMSATRTTDDYEKFYEVMMRENLFIATVILKGVSLSHQYSTIIEKTWNFNFHFLHTPQTGP